jgi:peptidyl-tRNA hydrolase
MKLKILYRKNLEMSPGKLAAQCVHAARRITIPEGIRAVVVLGVSNTKFNEAKSKALTVVKDAGYTEVEPGTETVLAFFEED